MLHKETVTPGKRRGSAQVNLREQKIWKKRETSKGKAFKFLIDGTKERALLRGEKKDKDKKTLLTGRTRALTPNTNLTRKKTRMPK